jgi:hypothetical protein
MGQGRIAALPITRFMPKVNCAGPIPAHRPELGPCWIWTAAVTKQGYGKFRPAGRKGPSTVPAHRWAYQHFVGPIHREFVCDHLCRNKLCVNPGHIEPVPNAVNILRGSSPNRERIYCGKGHEFTEENTYRTVKGHRQCRTCHRQQVLAAYYRKKGLRASAHD